MTQSYQNNFEKAQQLAAEDLAKKITPDITYDQFIILCNNYDIKYYRVEQVEQDAGEHYQDTRTELVDQNQYYDAKFNPKYFQKYFHDIALKKGNRDLTNGISDKYNAELRAEKIAAKAKRIAELKSSGLHQIVEGLEDKNNLFKGEDKEQVLADILDLKKAEVNVEDFIVRYRALCPLLEQVNIIKLKAAELNQRSENDASNAATNLYNGVIVDYNEFLKGKTDVDKFIENSLAKISDAEDSLKEHRGWKPALTIVANVILCLPLFAIKAKNMYTDNAQDTFYHSDTDSAEKISAMKKTIQDIKEKFEGNDITPGNSDDKQFSP